MADTEKGYLGLTIEEFEALSAPERKAAVEEAIDTQLVALCKLMGIKNPATALDLLATVPVLYVASTLGMLGQMLVDLKKIVPNESA